MKEYFLKLYAYNEWSNKRVLDCLTRQQVNSPKILTVMGHVVAAQHLWFHRINGLPAAKVELWGEYTLPQLISMSEDICKRWNDFVKSTDNFNRDLSYNNYVGDPYITNVETIMIHLVNHSSYHRAQIAMLLRQTGFEPVNTDLITYDRVLRGQWKD